MNVACGDRISLNRVIEDLRGILDVDIEPEYQDERPGDIKHSLAGIGLAEELLGYRPLVGFREGLMKTSEDFVDRAANAAVGP